MSVSKRDNQSAAVEAAIDFSGDKVSRSVHPSTPPLLNLKLGVMCYWHIIYMYMYLNTVMPTNSYVRNNYNINES